MRFTRFLTLLPVLGLLFLAACKDEPTGSNNTNNTATTKASLLTAKTWSTTLFTIQGEDAANLHFATTTFKSDGTVSGTMPDGKTDSGTWSFNADSSIIEVKSFGPGYNWTIDELTSSSIKVHDNNEESGSYALKLVWHAVPQ